MLIEKDKEKDSMNKERKMLFNEAGDVGRKLDN